MDRDANGLYLLLEILEELVRHFPRGGIYDHPVVQQSELSADFRVDPIGYLRVAALGDKRIVALPLQNPASPP